MANNSNLSVVILAAGKGSRMYSDLPKVLHPIAGKPMVQHVIDTAKDLNAKNIHVIYGFEGERLQNALSHENLNWVHQAEQLGTGHAMQQAMPFFGDAENILMLYGDTPLIRPATLQKLIDAKPDNGIALLTVCIANPTGYGRILRDTNNNVAGIVEEKDATTQQKNITEVNTGVMVGNGKDFKHWLAKLTNNNAQQEYYMTDVIALAHQDQRPVVAVEACDPLEVEGANNRLQLATLERHYQQWQREKLLLAGVMLQDPQRFDLRGILTHGKDVTIDVNVIIEGEVILGNKVKIGAGSILKNCQVGDGVEIKPYSIIENAIIGNNSQIGPFSRLRPETVLAEETHIGNFVEVKKSAVGKGSKINHLAYVGDAKVGAKCNIGAGVITCNYDGKNKHLTEIGDDVFVGSDCQLVAPVKIANGATIGAGTTLTKNVEQADLVISRTPQRHIAGWQRPRKDPK